jgi:DNA polymerase I-like protein with 3'-5' exonuclease and polymerase domains
VTTAAPANGVPTDARAAALFYLARGLMPIPVPFKGKSPGREGWQNLRATADAIDDLFPPGRRLNVGVLNGEPSGHLIDVDLDAIEAVVVGPYFLPKTGWVSGRNEKPRSHFWYKVDEAPDKAAEAFDDPTAGGEEKRRLLELRSTGSQTVVAPSVHPTGDRLGWHEFTEPARVDLEELRAAVRTAAASALLARHWPALGARHDARNALAGGLLRGGMPEDKVITFLEAVAAAANNIPRGDCANAVRTTAKKLKEGDLTTGWPTLAKLIGERGEAAVRQVCAWLGIVEKRAQTKSRSAASPVRIRSLPPYQPFPVDALPAPLADYVRQGAEALGCDPAYVALPVLSAVGAAIGNSRALRLKRGWEEPPVFWTAIVGDSGTLKTPAYTLGVRHLFRRQKHIFDDYKVAEEAYRQELRDYRKRERRADKDGSDPGDPPDDPILRRIVVSDTTIEKLARVLGDNPRGVLVARDELSAWLGSFTRYKGGAGGSDLPNWLQLHQAGTITVDRRTGDRPTLYVHPATASVTGGIQPGVLVRALTPEFLESGLVARFLLAMPPKRPKRWTEAEIDLDTETGYQRLLDHLLELEMDGGAEKTPHVLHLSPAAKDAWVAFYGDWAQEQVAAEGDMAAAFSKLEAYTARFALLHHVVNHVEVGTDDLRPVGTKSVEAGVTLCRWFADEDRRIYATLTEAAEDREARLLVEFIRSRGGVVSARDLMRSNSRKYPDPDSAEQALDVLAQAGVAEWVDRPPTTKGGRPSKQFRLASDADKTDKTPETDDGEDGPDDGSGATPPDTTPDTTPPGGQKPRVTEGFVGFVGCRTDIDGGAPTAGPSLQVPEGSVGQAEPSEGFVDDQPFSLVTNAAGLEAVRLALADDALVGLDIETTGLDPRTDRVRLLSLAVPTTDSGVFVHLVDCFAVDPRPLFDALAGCRLVAHNAAFDLSFLMRLGFEPGAVDDTMLLSQLLDGTRRPKGYHGLAECANRHLGRTLDKAEQKGRWSGELTPEQLRYAADDAEVLLPPHRELTGKIVETGQARAAEIETRALPAVAWLSSCGVGFDGDAWTALAAEAKAEAETLADRLDKEAPARPGALPMEGTWNWDAPADVKEALGLLGVELDGTDDDALAAAAHPFAALVRQYRSAAKLASTYGPAWAKRALDGGRLYAGWRQLGCATGRMASASPNLQNLPGDIRYRRCFAAPPGRVLVKADYSQIELRIAAKVTGDAALLDAYARGDDLHKLTARRMTGKAEVTKEERRLAKPVNFGLIYGLGVPSLRRKAKAEYGTELSEEEGRRYRDAFFAAYPGVARWHTRIKRERAMETRTLAGRRALVEADGFFGGKANYVVQGTGGDGIKQALALLWERRSECPGAFPVLVVHDEIVVEADAEQADAAKAWLTRAMVDGMQPLIAPVPVEVEAAAGPTWAMDGE